jgi:formylglycine-generating enzyme required for sulfatase activity
LACLTSAAESAFARGLGVEIAHLGGFQTPDTCEPNCGWQWLSGEPWSYTQWAPTQPDNGSGVEDVLELQLAGNWNDYEATSYRNSFIVEWSADCNSDGIVDYGQILSGQLIDANSNGIPDICEIGPCPGDISGNHAVDGVDLAALLGTWGTNGQGEFNCDVDHDGIVGGTDLTIILGGWGPCPPPVLPWATVLEQNVNPAVVTDATLRNAIIASGLPWRVRDNGTNIEMLLVPGGTFMMGCSPGDAECSGDESPAHQVTLTNAFYMGKTEVTQAQWLAKMGSNPSYFVGNPNNPVERVSWNMVQEFNAVTGLRLPTDAEWEYACRARTTSARYGAVNAIAWYVENLPNYSTQQVAEKLPNLLGLNDTLGNVWEWCQDWYGPYLSGSMTNPTGPATGSYRLLRGGSFGDNPIYCRSSQRLNNNLGYQNINTGFRVARTP